MAKRRRQARFPFPMPELFHGIYMVARHNAAGYNSFLLGEYRDHGRWNFFPVLMLVKTPIGFLLLAGAGMALVIGQLMRGVWQRRLTVCFLSRFFSLVWQPISISV